MRRLRNVNLILLSLAILLSCTDNIARKRVPVEIVKSEFPETATVDQDIEIRLKAQATNGCYSEFMIRLDAVDSRHFLFRATAMHSSGGLCPDVIVDEDTIITFRPISTGKYFFQTNEDPFKIERDTIEVN